MKQQASKAWTSTSSTFKSNRFFFLIIFWNIFLSIPLLICNRFVFLYTYIFFLLPLHSDWIRFSYYAFINSMAVMICKMYFHDSIPTNQIEVGNKFYSNIYKSFFEIPHMISCQIEKWNEEKCMKENCTLVRFLFFFCFFRLYWFDCVYLFRRSVAVLHCYLFYNSHVYGCSTL